MTSLRSKSVVAQISLARLLYSVQQWLIVAILARSHDPSQLANFGLASAIVIPSIGFIGFGLRQGIATDVNRVYGFFQYFTVPIISLPLGILLILVSVNLAYGSPALSEMIALYLFPKVVELFSEQCYGFMQRGNLIPQISFAMTLRAVLGGVAFTAAYYATDSVSAAIFAWGLAWLLVLALLEFPYARSTEISSPGPARQARNSVLPVIWVHFPLALSSLVGNLSISIPRIVIAHFGTNVDLASFTAISALFQAGNTMLVAVLQMLMTPLADAIHRAQGSRARRIIFSSSAGILLICVIGLAIVASKGGMVLGLIYGTRFAIYQGIFLLMSLAWSIKYLAIVFRYIPTAQRLFWRGISLDVFAVLFVGVGCAIAGWYFGGLYAMVVGFAIGQALSSVQTIVQGSIWLGRPKDAKSGH